MKFRDPISYLESVFNGRRKEHLQYSLRTFADDLSVPVSILSDMFNGKRGISRKRAESIAYRLGLSGWEREHFCVSANYFHGRSRRIRETAEGELKKLYSIEKLKKLSADKLPYIQEWYHFALIELLKVLPYAKIPELADRLNLSEHQCERALGRLEKVGLIEFKHGSYQPKESYFVFDGKKPDEAVRILHKGLMARATHAITTQSIDERHLSSLVLAFDTREFPKAQERIKEFCREFNREFSHGEPDEVYTLNLQFVRLTGKDVIEGSAELH